MLDPVRRRFILIVGLVIGLVAGRGRTLAERLDWRGLNEVELEAYDLIPRHLAETVRIVRIPLFFSRYGVFGRYEAMTLNRLILLTKPVAADGNSPLLAHELVHVGQWRSAGVVGFLADYLSDFISNMVRTRSWRQSYLAIEAEIDARLGTQAWVRRHLQSGRGGPQE